MRVCFIRGTISIWDDGRVLEMDSGGCLAVTGCLCVMVKLCGCV